MTRKLKPADAGTEGSVEIALGLLALARDELKAAGAGKSADAVREAIKSAGGALRHARRRASGEAEPKPGKVSRALVVVEVFGEAGSARRFATEVENLDLSQIGIAIDAGDWIGTSKVVGAANVPSRDLRRKLKSIGCADGSFFEGI